MMKGAVIMMQKNESLLLSAWHAFYSHIFGANNIYILDNGSDEQETLQDLENIRRSGSHVICDYGKPEHFEQKGELIGNFIKKLDRENTYDFYFPVDCDEFLALASGGGFTVSRSAIFAHLARYRGELRPLGIEYSYYNIPRKPGVYYSLPVTKTAFARGTLDTLDLGFHSGTTARFSSEERRPTELVYVHYHNKPFAQVVYHAREKLKGRVADFELDTLRNYNGRGQHLIKYFFMDEVEYEQQFPVYSVLVSDDLITLLGRLGMILDI